MELERNNEFIAYILDNLIPKAKFNEQTGKYEIKYEDYQDLELSTRQKKLLKMICENIGIDLESRGYIRMPLTCIEDEELFQEYNDIKTKLATNISEKEEELLEQRRIEIRNKIVEDNIPFIESIIKQRIGKINDNPEKDDIHQLGYETLIEYIDNNFLYKGDFKDQISRILIRCIANKLVLARNELDYRIQKDINIINDTKEANGNQALEELSKQINIDLKRLKELLVLENIVSATNIDDELATLNDSDDYNNPSLYDNSFEEILIDSISKKQIVPKIISTLSVTEQNILKLYYGFDGTNYTMQQLADIYRVTKARISSLINNALENIRNSIRINYLTEVSDTSSTYQFKETLQNEKLEEFLIRNLPPELLNQVIKSLNFKLKGFAHIYFFNKEYNLPEIAKILNISKSYASSIKKQIISNIRNEIIKILSKEQNKNITYEEYLDYLMKIYLSKGKIRRKVR